MSEEPLEALLDRLAAGDLQAAEQVFRAYGPYLRMVVRRHLPGRLRPKLDSLDVVQSVWADLVHGFRQGGRRFADADHLRAYLVRATRNHLTDHLRHHRTALDRERPLEELEECLPAREPRPSEFAQADDVWQKLLALCPSDHHEVLRLRREGLTLEEIAGRTGLHEGSVRRILRKLARQLACEARPPGDE
jgi:RNA polymerase sigma-70 factor (ECF subfamily)